MSKIEEALWDDYKQINELFMGIEVKTEEYKATMEERDKLRNELIKLEQIKLETEVKKSQIEAENQREKIRNAITIGTFTVSTCLSLFAISKTFKFDEVATVTSTLGRNILNGVIPKMSKR